MIARTVPVLAVIACIAGMLAGAIFGAPADGDLWWQRWLGDQVWRAHAIPAALGSETFSAAGAPWTAHEWLFGALLAGATAMHLDLAFRLAAFACAAGALCVVAAACAARGASVRATMLATGLAGLTQLPAAGLRVQVIGWLFAALFGALAFDARRRWWCIVITAVWANVHASAAIVPATFALMAAAALPECRTFGREVRALTALAAGCALALCATPLAYRLPLYAVSLVLSPIKANIVEWQSPLAAHDAFALALVAAVGGAFLARRARIPLQQQIVVAAYGVLALAAVRNLPLFGLMACPIVAATFRETPRVPQRRYAFAHLAAGLTLAAVAFAAGVWTSAASAQRRAPLPIAAAAVVASHAQGVRVYCADYSWCGLLVGRRGVSVFLDGRADPYPADVWAENRRIALTADAEPLLDRRAVNTVLAARGDALDRRLRTSVRWSAAYGDAGYVVYRRAPSPRVAGVVAQ